MQMENARRTHSQSEWDVILPGVCFLNRPLIYSTIIGTAGDSCDRNVRMCIEESRRTTCCRLVRWQDGNVILHFAVERVMLILCVFRGIPVHWTEHSPISCIFNCSDAELLHLVYVDVCMNYTIITSFRVRHFSHMKNWQTSRLSVPLSTTRIARLLPPSLSPFFVKVQVPCSLTVNANYYNLYMFEMYIVRLYHCRIMFSWIERICDEKSW